MGEKKNNNKEHRILHKNTCKSFLHFFSSTIDNTLEVVTFYSLSVKIIMVIIMMSKCSGMQQSFKCFIKFAGRKPVFVNFTFRTQSFPVLFHLLGTEIL